MSNFYYGGGDCSIEAPNVRGVEIRFQGIVKIIDKTPDSFRIIAGKNKIVVFPIGTGTLSDLFQYRGNFKVVSIKAVDNNGDIRYIQNCRLSTLPELYPSETEGKAGIYKWGSSPSAETGNRNVYIETNAIDFGDHARRKVVQSISFTYKSSADTELVPYVYVTYLNGVAPAYYYLCTSAASSIAVSDVIGGSYEGQLPTTSSKIETFTYKHVLDSKVTGDAVSMRSQLKNIGSLKIGLDRLHTGSTCPTDIEIEEISITYREKNPK